MTKPLDYELQQESVQSQNPYLQSETAKSYGINEVVERRPSSCSDFETNVVINLIYIRFRTHCLLSVDILVEIIDYFHIAGS